MKLQSLLRKGGCLLSAVLMLALPLASCSGSKVPAGSSTTEPADSSHTTRGNYDDQGYELDRLPENLDFDREKVSILYWSDVEMQEFEPDGKEGELVNDSIFARNSAVETRLNVVLNWLPQPGSSVNNAYNAFTDRVQNDYLSDMALDLFATYSPGAGILASRGYNRNLLGVNYFDPDSPWWPESLVDTCTINDKLFYASGDISVNAIHLMYGTYYNADLIRARGMQDPVDLVKSGEWTMEKMFEMASGWYQDAGTGNAADNTYGLVTHQIHLDSFVIAAGMLMVSRDENNQWCLSPDFTSSKLYDLIRLAGTNIVSSDDGWCGEGYQTIFVEKRSLFVIDRIYLVYHKLLDVKFSYGVVPMAKYSDTQEKYLTCVGHPFTLYCISSGISQERADIAGAVMECLASEAYRKTTPAVFNQLYQTRYVDNPVFREMFDLIRNGIVFDIGRIQNVATGQPYQMFQSGVLSVGSGWMMLNKANAGVLSEKIAQLVEDMKNFG